MLTWQQNSIKASFRGWGEGQDFQLELPMSFMLVYIVEYLKLFYREIFPLFFFRLRFCTNELKDSSSKNCGNIKGRESYEQLFRIDERKRD